MTDQEVTTEIKKAAALFIDGTYNGDDLAARLMQIVSEKNTEGALHKAVVEQLMHAVDEYMELKRQFKSGHAIASAYGLKKHELKAKVAHLKNRGYSVDRFEKKQEQKNLFT